MGTCFVIQPFDGGPFDHRFDDVLKPAIAAASLEAYRVDRDPAATVPIAEIEAGIRRSAVCLADITEDNPNVWFELGYAIAASRPVVLICAERRATPFPFDIQHRRIIKYSTEAPRGFEELKDHVTASLQAALKKDAELGKAVSQDSVADVKGLAQHELVALVSIAQNVESEDGQVAAYAIRQDMSRAGFTDIATTLALAALRRKQLISVGEDSDFNGNTFVVYGLEKAGMSWLMENMDKLQLKRPRRPAKGDDAGFDEVPF